MVFDKNIYHEKKGIEIDLTSIKDGNIKGITSYSYN